MSTFSNFIFYSLHNSLCHIDIEKRLKKLSDFLFSFQALIIMRPQYYLLQEIACIPKIKYINVVNLRPSLRSSQLPFLCLLILFVR